MRRWQIEDQQVEPRILELHGTRFQTVEIVDVLGRSVMTIPAQPMAAGAAQGLVVDASNLASGTYFYRVIARTATGTHVETGQMLLIK